jgi:geranylgeranyl pyrophosphate synthase
LVIGDYLLAKACVEGAKISGLIGEKIASTIAKLCDGESRELASQYNVNRSQTDYLLAIEGKTASLFAAACEIGGMCAGLDSSSISSLEKYGREFGMSFQLIDDLIDLLSTAELLGKPVGNDLKEGVYTMPILLALSGNSRKRLAALLTNKKQIVLDEVVNSLVNDQSIQRTLLYAKKYNKLAVKALSKSPGDYANLIELPDAYLNYCLENLVAKKYRSTVSGS